MPTDMGPLFLWSHILVFALGAVSCYVLLHLCRTEKTDIGKQLRVHQGAIDDDAITADEKVMHVLHTMLWFGGVQIQEIGGFWYRCRRPAVNDTDRVVGPTRKTIYGDAEQDIGDEVCFCVELTRLAGVDGLYSLDFRRLKGDPRSYSYLCKRIRDRAWEKLYHRDSIPGFSHDV